MFLFLSVIFLEVELLGHMITLCLTFSGNANCFPKPAVPFYTPTSNEGFHFSTSSSTHCYYFDQRHLSEFEVVTPVVWVYISLMADDIEHLFMYLLAICISPLKKCPFTSFAHVKNQIIYLLIIEIKCTLYNLDMSSLPNISLANILFQSVSCLFTFLILFAAQNF